MLQSLFEDTREESLATLAKNSRRQEKILRKTVLIKRFNSNGDEYRLWGTPNNTLNNFFLSTK